MTSDQSVLKSGATLALIAAICTALVAATYQLTVDRIADNDKALLEQSLQPALTRRPGRMRMCSPRDGACIAEHPWAGHHAKRPGGGRQDPSTRVLCH